MVSDLFKFALPVTWQSQSVILVLGFDPAPLAPFVTSHPNYILFPSSSHSLLYHNCREQYQLRLHNWVNPNLPVGIPALSRVLLLVIWGPLLEVRDFPMSEKKFFPSFFFSTLDQWFSSLDVKRFNQLWNLIFKYLGLQQGFFFFWLHWFFVAACGLSLVAVREGYSSLQCTASHCGGFSCCGAQALGARASVVVACGLQSAGSVVVAHGLSGSTACGIFWDQGSNPCPLHWQAYSQPLCH